MTIVARFYDDPKAYKSALSRAKERARKESEAVPLELPGFDGAVAFSHPRVRLYKGKDGGYVVERKP